MIGTMRTHSRHLLKLVIFDLDGVVYRGARAVTGVPELISWLHDDTDVAVRFATNNSMLTPQAFVERLAAMGIRAAADEVVTSTTATVDHLARHLPAPGSILVVGGSGLCELLAAAGYRVTPAARAVPAAYAGEPLAERYEAVVVGLDLAFSFAALAAAQAAVAAGARLIATNADARYPTERGFLPGAGSMVAAIATASGVQPIVIGKPAPAMFESILEQRGVAAADALVVGDNPDADIVAARRAGIPSLLVLTGVADAEMAAALDGDRRPDLVAAGPVELRDLIRARL
jgi:4-nitrophenyl phosphatase